MWVIVIVVLVVIVVATLGYGIITEVMNERAPPVIEAKEAYLEGYLKGFNTLAVDGVEKDAPKNRKPAYRGGFTDGQTAAKKKSYSPARAWAISEARKLAVEQAKVKTVSVEATPEAA